MEKGQILTALQRGLITFSLYNSCLKREHYPDKLTTLLPKVLIVPRVTGEGITNVEGNIISQGQSLY